MFARVGKMSKSGTSVCVCVWNKSSKTVDAVVFLSLYIGIYQVRRHKCREKCFVASVSSTRAQPSDGMAPRRPWHVSLRKNDTPPFIFLKNHPSLSENSSNVFSRFYEPVWIDPSDRESVCDVTLLVFWIQSPKQPSSSSSVSSFFSWTHGARRC